jgi:hypothetical protein
MYPIILDAIASAQAISAKELHYLYLYLNSLVVVLDNLVATSCCRAYTITIAIAIGFDVMD